MRGHWFLFIVLCLMMVFIGDCARGEEVTHKERLIEICGSLPGLPSIRPVTDETFDRLARNRLAVTDWLSCGISNAKTKRDWKFTSLVRSMSDRWFLFGLQEINKARREKIHPHLPSLDDYMEWTE